MPSKTVWFDYFMADYIESSLQEAKKTLDWLCAGRETPDAISQMVNCLTDCLSTGGKIITCGNGGSFCDAAHLAEELSGRFRRNRPALAALALSDGAFLTCAANDFGYEQAFARGVEALGKPGDVLVVFSCSGNSTNVVRAAKVAVERRLTVLGLLGRDGGELKSLCAHVVVVPGATTDRIQEAHVKILHLLVEGIERVLFPQNYEEGG